MESETLREITPSLADGRYSILATIKEGCLYLAQKAGKRFILKTAPGAYGLEMIKREYELSIALSHPGLAYVFTYEEDSPVGPCIVREYVDGETLDSWLSRKPSAAERRRIFSELLSVVSYLHQKGLIHNDLKPENILISKSSGALKLIDFGFSDDDTHLGKAIGGTRTYASPELLAGRSLSASSDVYSLGLILRDIFPYRYGRIICRCLRHSPSRRYASARELGNAWRRRLLPAFAASITALVLVLGALLYPSIMRARALACAKAEVDNWYDTEVPTFLDALSKAATDTEVTDAWTAFVGKTNVINNDIPSRLPEEIRPRLRDYVIERYNSTFPALQDSLVSRMREISR